MRSVRRRTFALRRGSRGAVLRGEVIHLMNWDQVEGKWKQVKGSLKERWGKLTDDDLDKLAGKRDQLTGKMQERYGVTKEEADRRLEEWRKTLRDEEKAQRAGSGSSTE